MVDINTSIDNSDLHASARVGQGLGIDAIHSGRQCLRRERRRGLRDARSAGRERREIFAGLVDRDDTVFAHKGDARVALDLCDIGFREARRKSAPRANPLAVRKSNPRKQKMQKGASRRCKKKKTKTPVPAPSYPESYAALRVTQDS